MSGAQVDAAAYLGRLLAPRRLRGRDGGRLELPESETNSGASVGLPAALPGQRWVSMSPVGEPGLGAEICDGLSKGIRLDERHGAVPTALGWSLVQLVDCHQIPALVDSVESALRQK